MTDTIDCRCPRARHQHGTYASYVTCGCGCFICRVAYAARIAERRAGITTTHPGPYIDSTGTRRRIEALHRVGWSGAQIGARLGVTFNAVHQWRTERTRLCPSTTERVAGLYDELWDQPANGPHVVKTVRWAQRRGFLPPLAWDDDEIDDPTAHPHTPPSGPWDHKPCGTTAAYRRHLRRDETPCHACATANRIVTAERRTA